MAKALVPKVYYKFVRKMKAYENIRNLDLNHLNSFVGNAGVLFSDSCEETHLAIEFESTNRVKGKKTYSTCWFPIAKRCLRRSTKREIYKANSSKLT